MTIVSQKIKKILKTHTTLVVALLCLFAGINFSPLKVSAATDSVLAACNKAIANNIEKKACSTANIKKAKDAANKVCVAELNGAQGPPAPKCVNDKAISYIQNAAKPAPKSAQAFSNQLDKITKNATASAPKPNPSTGSGSTKTPENCSIDSGKCDLVAKYLNPLINLLAGLVGVAAVISLIIGGIQYTTSGGDPQKVTKAKNRIGMTVIALLGFFFLFGFLQFLIPGGLF